MLVCWYCWVPQQQPRQPRRHSAVMHEARYISVAFVSVELYMHACNERRMLFSSLYLGGAICQTTQRRTLRKRASVCMLDKNSNKLYACAGAQAPECRSNASTTQEHSCLIRARTTRTTMELINLTAPQIRVHIRVHGTCEENASLQHEFVISTHIGHKHTLASYYI